MSKTSHPQDPYVNVDVTPIGSAPLHLLPVGSTHGQSSGIHNVIRGTTLPITEYNQL